MIDLGATRALLNRDYYYRTPSLYSCPRYKLPEPAYIRSADRTLMMVHECIDLLIQIQEHVFKINAYILPHMDTQYGLILGSGKSRQTDTFRHTETKSMSTKTIIAAKATSGWMRNLWFESPNYVSNYI